MKRTKLLYVVLVWGLIFSLLFSCQKYTHSNTKRKIVKKIDHVLIAPDNVRGLLNFFNEVLQLPVAWKYKSYGDFSSGGFYSGNVNLEIIDLNKIGTETSIKGIAFEPNGTTEKIVKEMNQRNILFKKPVFHEDPNFKEKPDKNHCWTTTNIMNILPGSWIFFCEYHRDNKIIESRKNNLQIKLDKRNGGPLGIEYVSEIKVKVDSEHRIKKWIEILYPIKEENYNVFKMGAGPSLRFVKSDKNCIYAIKFKVQSLDTALEYLKKCKIFGKKESYSISTDPDKTYGVLFEFSEI